MERKFTPELLQTLRVELNEAVKEIGDKHGVKIRFGNAKYEDLTATYQVSLEFAASEGFDPAKALWDQNCRRIGMDPEDFGKEFCFLGETERYAISGYNAKGRSNCVLIRRLRDGKEFITTPLQVNTCLGKSNPQQTAPPAQESKEEAEGKAEREWKLNCWRIGMKPEDFGKIVTLDGKLFRICGIKPTARVNSVLVRNTITGKEYVTSPQAIQAARKI